MSPATRPIRSNKMGLFSNEGGSREATPQVHGRRLLTVAVRWNVLYVRAA